MEKAKLKNKALLSVLEDAQDGVLKDASVETVRDILKDAQEAPKSSKSEKGYSYKGKVYSSLRELDMPLTQAQERLAAGLITIV